MNKLTVILIDDDTPDRRAFVNQLKQLKLQVIVNDSLTDAVQAEKNYSIDIVMLAIDSVNENTISLLNELKMRFPYLYSFVICKRENFNQVANLINNGIDNYLIEPISMDLLKTGLSQAVSSAKLREESHLLIQDKQKSRRFYENLLNNSNEAIVVINQNFEIQYCNLTFQKFMNSTEDGLLEQNLQHYIDDGFKVLHHVYQQLTAGKKIDGYRVSLKPESNKVFDVNLSADFLYTEQGYVEGLIITMENRTLHDEVFTQLMRKEKLSTIQHLANALAHEIHNLINILSGRIQLLKKELVNTQHNKSFEIINRQIERISEIISQLQKFNHNREDTIPEVFAPIEFLEQFLKHWKTTTNIKYLLQYQQKEKDILIQANRYQFEVAFTYLFRTIENLVAPKTALKIHCHLLKTFAQNPSLELQIDLSNTGVSEDIFEPFQSAIPNDKFSSLDLALIHTIFSNYGGKIQIDSLFGDKKVLRLQFIVAGVKNPVSGQAKKQNSLRKSSKRNGKNQSNVK